MVRTLSLPKPTLQSITCLLLSLGGLACGRKGDPIPSPRAAPQACIARWVELRTLEVRLPVRDIRESRLRGVEQVRVYFLPLGPARPTPLDVLSKGEVILEKRRPDLPAPGSSFQVDLQDVSRPTGWIVVAAVRVGNVVGAPSEILPWLEPTI